jgi:hypothetical protein
MPACVQPYFAQEDAVPEDKPWHLLRTQCNILPFIAPGRAMHHLRLRCAQQFLSGR